MSSHASRCAAAHEGVEHHTAFRTPSEYARANQLFGIYGEMSVKVWLRVDCPNIALVSLARRHIVRTDFALLTRAAHQIGFWVAVLLAVISELAIAYNSSGAVLHRGRVFLNLLVVEVVTLRLAQQEDVFVRLGAAVSRWLGHHVGLVPNDVLPQIPALCSQRESQHPGDTD